MVEAALTRATAREPSFAAGFTSALLDPSREAPALVAGPGGKTVGKRYNVYRNNVIVSLIGALAETFPATQRLVGEEFFRAMARIHVRQSPPTSPLLFEYGRDFPDFIGAFEHARGLPYLADVARIERAWLDAYHAADAAPMTVEKLAAIPVKYLGDTVFMLHPATRVVRSRHPAVTIFAMNRSGGAVDQVELSEPEDALVTRPRLDVTVRRLPPGGAAFLASLIAGDPLGVAADAGMRDSAEFDLPTNIAGMIEAGVFTDIAPAIEGEELDG